MSFDQLPEDLILGGREERLRRALMQQLRGGAALAPTAAPPMAAAPKPQAISNPPPLTNATQGMSGRTATSAAADNGIDARMTDIEGQLEKFRQPADYSGLEKYAGERKESGNNALMLALAAQAAGDPAKPILEVMLKRSLAAQNPEKYLAGNVTDQGFVEDPDYGRQNTRNSLEAQLTRLASEKDKIQSREDTAQWRNTMMANRPQWKTDAAGNAGWYSPGGAVTPVQGFVGAESTQMGKLGEKLMENDVSITRIGDGLDMLKTTVLSRGGMHNAIVADLLPMNFASAVQQKNFPMEVRAALGEIQHAFAPEIHALYGAALTGNELNAANYWRPSPGDDVATVINKAQNFKYYLGMSNAVMRASRGMGARSLTPDQYRQVIEEYKVENGSGVAGKAGVSRDRSRFRITPR